MGGSQKQPPTNRSTALESASPRQQDKNTTSPRQDPGIISSPTSMESPQRPTSITERCASPSLKISVTAPASPVLSLAGGEKNKPKAIPSKLTKTSGLSSPATCIKVAMKEPGVTSPKKHVGKRRPKRSSTPVSKSSSKTKLLGGNGGAATNKNTCRSPGQAKDTPDGVGAEIGNVAAVASPKIQSPVANRKGRRTRIDTAEMAVIKVTPGYLSPEMRAHAHVQQDGASGSGPLSNTSSPASPGDGQPEIRRPSILKVPGTSSKARVMALLSSGTSYRPDDFMRRPSTVDFGPLECRMLPSSSEYSDVKPESQEPPSTLRASAPVGAVPSTQTGTEPTIPTSVADSRSLRVSSPSEERGFGVGRRVSVSNTNALLAPGPARRPASPSTGNKGNYTVVGNIQSTEDKNAIRRKNASHSMRTAFVLCSSLVTMTASLCSTITIASRHALLTHRMVNPGPHGFLVWLVLGTPTALLSTVCCCLLLYLQHLRSSDVMQSAKDHRNVCIAAGKKLRKLGPVSGHDYLLVYAFIFYLLFMLMAPIFHYNIKDNLVVFGSGVLIMTSAMPWSASQYWHPERRMVCWSAVARDLPWPVVIVQCAVLLIARTVEARETRVAPVLYAVPVAMSVSSNMILPIRIPLIVAHEVIDVPMAQLALIGVVVKTVIVFTSIFSVNTFGRYLISLEPLDTNATLYSNDTYLAFGA